MSWRRRKFWGARFTGLDGTGHLVGSLWHDERMADMKKCPHLSKEPTRALLFITRQEARDWCRKKQAQYLAYPAGHVCRTWRMRPVRVIESVSEDSR